MARGLTRAQLGITDSMLATFGEAVFRMSHNLQVREGDPIRRLDWKDIERQNYLYGPLAQELWYKMAIGEGEMVAQCFECMRVCPVARTAPQADPVRRWAGRQLLPVRPA